MRRSAGALRKSMNSYDQLSNATKGWITAFEDLTRALMGEEYGYVGTYTGVSPKSAPP
jgi:hypothetical protein